MPPFLGGGEMIKEVSFDGTVFNDAPHKFEAGTPNIAGFVGLGVAVDYLQLGCRSKPARPELLAHFTEELRASTACASSAKRRTRRPWCRS
jgi:cysteine desulfurase/selenocysteine lyase